MMHPNQQGRIEVHDKGIGAISESVIEQRAVEIARIDGRSKPSAADRILARQEMLNPGPPPAAEADETVTPVALWSESLASHGHQAPKQETEDDSVLDEQLVNEGVEEADHEQRLESESPDSTEKSD